MARRRFRYGILFALALACGAIACRQLVGIHDDPVGHDEADASSDAGAPACGIAFAPSACAACAEQNCCAQAKACNGDIACKAAESCLAACAGDFHCRARCAIDFPVGTIDSVPALDQCLATSCEAPCGIACGGQEYFFDPDAAVACSQCLNGGGCASTRACAQNLECQAYARCAASCRTPDCSTACGHGRDAGTALIFKELDDVESACRSACAIGGYWACVGGVTWPIAKAPDLALTVTVTNAANSMPVDGVSVKMCGSTDLTCASDIAQGTTADGGTVVLVQHGIARNNPGANGFLDLSSPDINPSLYFWSFPLSEPNAAFEMPITTFSPAALDAFIGSTGQMIDHNRGQVAVFAVDCLLVNAPGVEISVTDVDGGTLTPIYLASNRPSATATSTDTTGIALFVNVDPGRIDVTVTPKALGRKSSHTAAYVRKGADTIVWLPPTPL